MSFYEDVIKLQRFAGVKQDGDFREISARALVVKLGLDTVSPPASGLKLAIDSGHGQDNRKMGVYDSGAVHGTLEEADVTLTWAKELVRACRELNIVTFETRPNKSISSPLNSRAPRAKSAGCTHFLSIHVNDADSPAATGTETWYKDDRTFAEKIQSSAMSGLNLSNRGVKQGSFAVLNFVGQACLLELGFIKNANDVARFTDGDVIAKTCKLIASTISKL